MMKRETLEIKSWSQDFCIMQAVALQRTNEWRVKKELHKRIFSKFCIILEKQTSDEQFFYNFESFMAKNIGKGLDMNRSENIEALIRYYKLLPQMNPNTNFKDDSDFMIKFYEKKLEKLRKA